jgi:hypothetical protein
MKVEVSMDIRSAKVAISTLNAGDTFTLVNDQSTVYLLLVGATQAVNLANGVLASVGPTDTVLQIKYLAAPE